LLTGDVRGKFTELSLFDAPSFDHDGPIWTGAHEDAPGFVEIAVLRSGRGETKPRDLLAFEMRLLPLGVDVLSRVVSNDAVALAEAGRFMLYKLGELTGAIIYLERAYAGGAPDVAIDLAVAALFTEGETS
jgi:hypothetical protein